MILIFKSITYKKLDSRVLISRKGASVQRYSVFLGILTALRQIKKTSQIEMNFGLICEFNESTQRWRIN